MTWRDVVAKTKGTHRTVWGSTRFDVLGTVLKVGNALIFVLDFCFWLGGFGLGWLEAIVVLFLASLCGEGKVLW